jgi:hypothetical protein
LQERVITGLLIEEPVAEIVTWAKDARVRERWGREWATEEEEGNWDGEEACKDHEKIAGHHGYWGKRVVVDGRAVDGRHINSSEYAWQSELRKP